MFKISLEKLFSNCSFRVFEYKRRVKVKERKKDDEVRDKSGSSCPHLKIIMASRGKELGKMGCLRAGMVLL